MTGWHIIRDDRALTLSRHAVPRFDVAAETRFPPLRMLPLAQMIRQDMWRLLQRLRGFAPVVTVRETETGLHVTAGGSLACPAPKRHVEAEIRSLLESEDGRLRWERCARLTQGKGVL